MDQLNKYLKELGFRDKEIIVYLTILEQGKITPARISKITNIKRSTVYSVVKELLDKGVVLEDFGSSTKFFIALPPENMKILLKKEEKLIQYKKTLIEQTIEELQNFSKNTKYSIPKVTFIYKEDLEDFLYKQAPEWNKSIINKDGFWWGYQDPTFVEYYQKWIDWFWNKCASKQLILKLLSTKSSIEDHMRNKGYDRRLIKFLEKDLNFSATTWINGDYIVMIVTNKKPFYLVQIYDSVMADNMRNLFKTIWEDIK